MPQILGAGSPTFDQPTYHPPLDFKELIDGKLRVPIRGSLDVCVDFDFIDVEAILPTSLGWKKMGEDKRLILGESTLRLPSDFRESPAKIYEAGPNLAAIINGTDRPIHEQALQLSLYELNTTVSILPHEKDGRINPNGVISVMELIRSKNIGGVLVLPYSSHLLGYQKRDLESFESILRTGHTIYSPSGSDFSLGCDFSKASLIPMEIGYKHVKNSKAIVIREDFDGIRSQEYADSVVYLASSGNSSEMADVTIINGVDTSKEKQGQQIALSNLQTMILVHPNQQSGVMTKQFLKRTVLEIMRYCTDHNIDSMYCCIWEGIAVGYHKSHNINLN